MKIKKEWIALFIGVLIAVNIINIIAIITLTESRLGEITGKAVTGQASICIVKPGNFETIPHLNATVGEVFTYQTNIKFYWNNSSLAYYDNSSLFDINQSGYISFIPASSDVADHTILLTAQDSSNCLAVNSTTSFLLSIASGGTTSTPSTTTPIAGAGGGAGGGGGAAQILEPEKESSFTVSKKTIQTTVKTSKESRQTITITNDGETDLEVSISDFPSIIDISPTDFTLTAGSSQDIMVIINPQHAEPNIYTGEITITSGRIIKTINVVIQVESEVVIFDGKVELSGDLNRILPGSTIQAEISIGGLIPGEVTLEYLLLDTKGNSFSLGSEVIGIEGEAKIVREFKIPDNLEAGDYTFAIKMISGESFATTTENFKIPPSTIAGQAFASGKTAVTRLALPLMFLGLLTIAVIVYTLHIRTKRHGEIIRASPRKTKLVTKTITKTIVKTKPAPAATKDDSYLKHKLALIQEGYKEGAIDPSTYKRSKEKIEQLLGR